jgi:hypothetical protein
MDKLSNVLCNRRKNKEWYIHAIENYSEIEVNDLWIPR